MNIKNLLANQPDLLGRLSSIDLEFLRWLIEKYSDPRAFRRWANAVGHQILLDLAEQPFDDIYPTDLDLAHVQGQIDELVTLSQHLGFEGVVVLIDINEADILRETILEKIQDLFGWLTPLQFEGFAIKATVPERIVEQTRLVDQSRGRVNFVSLGWSVEDCRGLSNRHLQAATDCHIKTLEQIASEELLTALGSHIQTLYKHPSPRSWLQMTAILLEVYVKVAKTLPKESKEDIIYNYFTKYMPLKLDKMNQGVWLGEQFIALDNQPYSFLEVLWRHKKNNEGSQAGLRQVAGGSQGNLNTIASRLRKMIEPLPQRPIYIYNSRSQGYWLENFVEEND